MNLAESISQIGHVINDVHGQIPSSCWMHAERLAETRDTAIVTKLLDGKLRNEVLRILEAVGERHCLFSVRTEAKRLLATCLALLDKGGTKYDYHADP